MHWTVENSNHYSDNMTILATLWSSDGVEHKDAEIGAFIEGQCRGSIKCMDGYYFLTVLGNPSEDANKPVTLKVWLNDTEYEITDKTFLFFGDASYGSFADGVMQLTYDIETGIKSMHNSQCTMHNEVYDLQGRKVNGQSSMFNGQLKKGLYIVNGKKEVVK